MQTELLKHCRSESLIGTRDRALLALGVAGAFRRSELVALKVEDPTECPDGLRVLIRHSKTGQEGAGQEVAILPGGRTCPVKAAQVWLQKAEHGASIFKVMDVSHHKSVDTLHRYVRRAGDFKDHTGGAFL